MNLYETKLPVCLRSNTECAIYLVKTLKMTFETWFADAVIELTNKPYDDDDNKSNKENKVDPNSDSFIVMVQNVVRSHVEDVFK